jgi:hypothetical protein
VRFVCDLVYVWTRFLGASVTASVNLHMCMGNGIVTEPLWSNGNCYGATQLECVESVSLCAFMCLHEFVQQSVMGLLKIKFFCTDYKARNEWMEVPTGILPLT